MNPHRVKSFPVFGMQRVVLDTNIYISAMHFQGSITRKILELAERGFFRLLISKQILAEIRGILRVKFKSELPKLDLIEQLTLSICSLVEPKMRIKYILEDPDDDKILKCAIEEKKQILLTPRIVIY